MEAIQLNFPQMEFKAYVFSIYVGLSSLEQTVSEIK